MSLSILRRYVQRRGCYTSGYAYLLMPLRATTCVSGGIVGHYMTALPRILVMYEQLRHDADQLVELEYEIEPQHEFQLPRFLGRIQAAWEHRPDPSEVVRVGAALVASNGCVLCGGCGVVPNWVAQLERWSDPAKTIYAEANGRSPVPCPTCGHGGNPPTSTDPACGICGESGWVPEWAAMAIERGHCEPQWVSKRQFDAEHWFPTHCRACGGWGRISTASVTTASAPLSQTSAPSPTDEHRTLEIPSNLAWRRHGTGWTVVWGDRKVDLSDQKGFQRIATLLAQPRTPIHVYELADLKDDYPGDDAIARADRGTLSAATEKLAEEIEAATDGATRLALQDQLEKCNDYMVAGTGRGGRARRMADGSEKARKRESNAIARAIREVGAKGHDELHQYLDRTIETGRELIFTPMNDESWNVSL